MSEQSTAALDTTESAGGPIYKTIGGVEVVSRLPVEPPLPIQEPPEDTHACELRITFPTDLQAEQAMQIMQVDSEPTDRVSKSFRLDTRQGDEGESIVALVV